MKNTLFREGEGYQLPHYPFQIPPELGGAMHPALKSYPSGHPLTIHPTEPTCYPVVIVGAGLAGLSLACDLASRGIATVVIDEDNTVGVRGASSRGIVYVQKTLEMMDRLGVFEDLQERGITWSVGKTLAGNEVVYQFDASKNNASRQPPFINIQQFYLESFLVDRINQLGITDLRWNNKLLTCSIHKSKGSQTDDYAEFRVSTPAGEYTLRARWLLDCSGLNSPVVASLGLPIKAERGIDRWCISDVRFQVPLPIERWTWVEAPFNENRAVWQHLMADGVWRMDFQMPVECNLEEVSSPEVASDRIRRQVGEGVAFELVWVGPYSYRAQLLDRFRVGPVFFLGDSAHVMSPFGARGGNSGIQDAENLAWKVAMVLKGYVSPALLDSYHHERRPAAQWNIKVTGRTNRFLTPRSGFERLLRESVLSLAKRYPFARTLVNTGRLSIPFVYADTILNGQCEAGQLPLGTALPNIPLDITAFMREEGSIDKTKVPPSVGLVSLLKEGFLVILYGQAPTSAEEQSVWQTWFSEVSPWVQIRVMDEGWTRLFPRFLPLGGSLGLLRQCLGLGAEFQGMVLIRPDQHVAAIWAYCSPSLIKAYLRSKIVSPSEGEGAMKD